MKSSTIGLILVIIAIAIIGLSSGHLINPNEPIFPEPFNTGESIQQDNIEHTINTSEQQEPINKNQTNKTQNNITNNDTNNNTNNNTPNNNTPKNDTPKNDRPKNDTANTTENDTAENNTTETIQTENNTTDTQTATNEKSPVKIKSASFTTNENQKGNVKLNLGNEHSGEQVTISATFYSNGQALNPGTSIEHTIPANGEINIDTSKEFETNPDSCIIIIKTNDGIELKETFNLKPQNGTQTISLN